MQKTVVAEIPTITAAEPMAQAEAEAAGTSPAEVANHKYPAEVVTEVVTERRICLASIARRRVTSKISASSGRRYKVKALRLPI